MKRSPKKTVIIIDSDEDENDFEALEKPNPEIYFQRNESNDKTRPEYSPSRPGCSSKNITPKEEKTPKKPKPEIFCLNDESDEGINPELDCSRPGSLMQNEAPKDEKVANSSKRESCFLGDGSNEKTKPERSRSDSGGSAKNEPYKDEKIVKKPKPELYVLSDELKKIKRLKYSPSRPRGWKKQDILLIQDAFISMTPINVIFPATYLAVEAKRDYLIEEKKFFSVDDPPRWDDGPKSKARVGEYFFFVHNQLSSGKDLAEAFLITEKRSSEHRPPHWRIPEHQTRSVIVLSTYIGYCSATELLYAAGYRKSMTEGKNCLRGTNRSKLVKDLRVWIEF